MRNSIKSVLAVVTLGLLVGQATHAGEEPDVEGHQVDSILELDLVRDIALEGDDGTVLLTLEDRVLQFSTFPLRLQADVETEIAGISSASASDGRLVVLGNDFLRGEAGSILLYDRIGRSLDERIEPFVYPLDITPFSQILLTDQNDIFAVNPTWFSVISANLDELWNFWVSDDEQATFKPSDLYLQCGNASTISVFVHRDEKYYVTSVTGSKTIEFGPVMVNQPKVKSARCFEPVETETSLTKNGLVSGGQALLHELVDNPYADAGPREVSKSLLTFDPDTNDFVVYPFAEFRGEITTLRSERIETSLASEITRAGVPASRLGLLASNDSGSVIWVSFVGGTVVHRMDFVGDTVEYMGRFNFSKPIRKLEISNDGFLGAIVVGDSRQGIPEEVILVKNPGTVPAFEPLERERYSIQNVQMQLDGAGFELEVDGVFGPQTKGQAVKYLGALKPAKTSAVTQTQSATATATAKEPELKIIESVGSKPTSEIGQALRGIFPLN